MFSKERVKRAFYYQKPDCVPISYLNLKSDFLIAKLFNPKTWQPINYPPHVPGGVNSISKFYYRLLIYKWEKKYLTTTFKSKF